MERWANSSISPQHKSLIAPAFDIPSSLASTGEGRINLCSDTLYLPNRYLCAIWFKLLHAFDSLPYTASLAHMPIHLFLLWIAEWRNFTKRMWSWYSTLLQPSIGLRRLQRVLAGIYNNLRTALRHAFLVSLTPGYRLITASLDH